VKENHMIIVTGSILARADTLDELLSLSLEHVRRSRTEPGCHAHGVYQDAENRLRLVFFEEWADREALVAHFAVLGSIAFAKAARALAAEPPKINIYEARPIQI
jgi:quinol monooxygenase YgiN